MSVLSGRLSRLSTLLDSSQACRRWEEHPNDGGQIERRWMKTPTGEYDPQQVRALLCCCLVLRHVSQAVYRRACVHEAGHGIGTRCSPPCWAVTTTSAFHQKSACCSCRQSGHTGCGRPAKSRQPQRRLPGERHSPASVPVHISVIVRTLPACCWSQIVLGLYQHVR